MTTRTTQNEIHACIEALMDATGNRWAAHWNDVGGWQLDHNGVYGGYQIEEISNPLGGVRLPFGEVRMVAREFTAALRFATKAAYMARADQRRNGSTPKEMAAR